MQKKQFNIREMETRLKLQYELVRRCVYQSRYVDGFK